MKKSTDFVYKYTVLVWEGGEWMIPYNYVSTGFDRLHFAQL